MILYTKDVGRDNVYQWEDALICDADPLLPTAKCELIFYKLSEAFGYKDAIMVIGDDPWAPNFSYQMKNKISLRPDCCKLSIICHEFAHLILYYSYIDYKITLRAHGPEWLTMYIYLLHKVCGVDILTLITTAKKAKLKFYASILRDNI